MIEVSVPRDIREYEPTVIGTLTARQLVCSVALVLMVYGGWFLEKAIGIADPVSEAPFFIFLAIPPFLVGWQKPYGMPFEKFIVKAYQDNFRAPQKRIYKVENMWDVILEEEHKEALAEQRRNRTNMSQPKSEVIKETPRSKLPDELKAYR